tara:strand:+ start:237 stop:395 length:159 start_codon:yes stop_codon:yes gene_type:complete
LLLQLALLGVAFNGAPVLHAPLVEQLAAGLGIGVGVALGFIQVSRHRGQLPS